MRDSRPKAKVWPATEDQDQHKIMFNEKPKIKSISRSCRQQLDFLKVQIMPNEQPKINSSTRSGRL